MEGRQPLISIAFYAALSLLTVAFVHQNAVDYLPLILIFPFFLSSLVSRKFRVYALLLVIPFGIVLPPRVGALLRFENMFLATDLLVPLFFGGWLISYLLKSKEKQPAKCRKITYLPFVALLVGFLLSYKPSINLRFFVSQIERWITYFMLYLIISRSLTREEEVKRASKFFIVSCFAVTIITLLGHFSIIRLPLLLHRLHREPSFISSSVRIPRLYLPGIGLFFLITLGRIFGVGKRLPVSLWIMIVVFMGAVFLTFSRGLWIAIIGAILVLAWVERKVVSRSIAVTFLSLILVLLVLAALGYLHPLFYRWYSLRSIESIGTISPRMDYWNAALKMFRSSPITGVGLGQYGEKFDRYVYQVFSLAPLSQRYAMTANNQYLEVLATTGLVGFSAFTYFMLFFFLKILRVARNVNEPTMKGLVLGGLMCFVAFAVMSIYGDPFWKKTETAILFVMLGMVRSIELLKIKKARLYED